MAAATVGAVSALHLWNADLRQPLRYSDDSILNLMFVKRVLENGWYYENPRLGVPVGQQLYDFPVFAGDNLNVLLLKMLGLGSSNPALVMNVFFMLTFPLVALTAFLVLRRLRVSGPSALVCATLYALLPYHFLRGETHLLLSAYYAVPLAAYLVLAILLGESLFSRRPESRSRFLAWVSHTTVVTVALCVVLAGAAGSFYYSGFAVVLIAVATVVRFAATRQPRNLATGGGVILLLLALTIGSLTPTIAYRSQHGTNPERVGERRPFESEYYSLRLTQLLLPLDHRLKPLSDVRDEYDEWSNSTGIPVTEAALTTLGTAGALGFLGLLGVLVVSAVGGDRRRPAPIYRSASVATIAAFMIATMGGLSSFIGWVFPNLRAWNRLSIFIAFFALLALGCVLDGVARRFESMGLEKRALGGLLATLLVLGVLDQTSPLLVPSYQEVNTAYQNDLRFVEGIEKQLRAGAAVFELPYAEFPEGTTPERTGAYDFLRPYVHSRDLRWSSGAMRGRPADWAARLAEAPLSRVMPAISAVGFEGVYVDRAGYADNGAAAMQDLTKILSVQPSESTDKRFLFYDMRYYNQRLIAARSRQEIERLRAATLGSAAG